MSQTWLATVVLFLACVLTFFLANAKATNKPFTVADKLTPDERVDLVRGLSSEFAIAKELLPRSRKPLEINSDGSYIGADWVKYSTKDGMVARSGDQVKITQVILLGDKLLLEINGGNNKGGHWYDHVEMGTGNRTSPISKGEYAPNTGTSLEILFHKPMEDLNAAAVKKILSPVLDFDKHSAATVFADTLPPEVKKAIAEKRAEDGMDRDQVLLALGHPDRKIRETKEGVELEDWIFGAPPGKITFVTFEGNKVVKVKVTYAGLGGEAAQNSGTPVH